MRLRTFSLLLLITVLFTGCGSRLRQSSEQGNADTTAPGVPRQEDQDRSEVKTAQRPADGSAKMQTVSLNDADKSQTATAAIERKIIRNAEMNLEVADPTESQRRISSFAESHGGFVVTTDASQRQGNDRTRPEMTVKVVARVPAAQFDVTINEIRSVASRVIQEKTTGQDVTEEFIDLEARIRTKKAVEAQFLEIMKQAKSVSDALEVQRELGEVRTQIEQLEGRRRFLENQASLSTITVTLQSPTPIVSTSGFFYSVKEAFKDGVDLAATITLFLIRAIITLLPVLIFIFLPLALIVRYLIRRTRRERSVKRLANDETLPSTDSK